MGITQLTLILLPCCLVWAMNPVRLLQAMIVAAVFEAGAALTIGSLGVQPGLMPGLGFLGFIILQLLLGARYPGAALTWPMVRPFVIVTGWAIASSILLPRLLEGQVYVWPQKNDPPFAIRPLQPTAGNINQDVYLLINCGLLLLTSTFLTSPAVRLRPLLNTYLATGFLAAGIAAWQLASKMAGVPFPDQLFYSNPGLSILTSQNIGAIPRLNGPFSEPSSLAGYMASIVCCSGWLLIRGHTSLWLRLLLLTGLGTMILSTSTTGFAVLVMAGVLVPGMAAIKGDTRLMMGIVRLGLPLVLVVALAGLIVSVAEPALFDSLSEIADSSLNKKDSSSYEERTSADIDSLTAFVDSYGLGVGWGSNRSSSLIPGLLASLGVPGMLALGWFGTTLVREVSRARRLTIDSDLLFVIDGCCGALTGYLLGAVISAPTLTSTTFYFLLAVLTATIAKIKIANLQQYYVRAARQGRSPSGGTRPPAFAGTHASAGLASASAVRSSPD